MTSTDIGDTGGDGDGPREAMELRSYGRRRGRKLSPRQERLMRELLPRLAIDLGSPPPSSIRNLFPAPDAQWASEGATMSTPVAGGPPKADVADIWLEIGFGGGEHLLWQARHHPHVGLIGAEPFEDGVVKVLAAIEDEGLANLRIHADDARDLPRWLPPASIGRVFVLFPDPWPKRRHVKRRLVNPHLLAMLARVMRRGGELRIGTDIGDYARTIMMAMQACPSFEWTARSPVDWRVRPADWPPTRYEEKAHREGRRCCYLRFVRRDI